MDTHEVLFAAVRLIKTHCEEHHNSLYCLRDCPFRDTCDDYFYVSPRRWDVPDKEGGDEGTSEKLK